MKISNKKMCSICLEEHPAKKVSHCINCMECGNTCHDCESKWVEQNNDPIKCSVCKQDTKQNIKPPVSENNIESIEVQDDCCKMACFDKTMRLLICTIIVLLLMLGFMLGYGIYWIIQKNE